MTAPATDNLRNTAKRTMLILLSACLLLMAWHLLIAGLRIPAYLVPGPLAVLKAYLVNWKVIATQTGFTLSAAALGLTISTIFASTIALSFSMSRSFAQASLPVVIAFRSAPVAAVAPIIMLFLGRGINTSMVVVTIVSFFPLLARKMHRLGQISCKVLIFRGIKFATQISAAFAEPHRP
jgi:NitT/TauT family transport system permease protein